MTPEEITLDQMIEHCERCLSEVEECNYEEHPELVVEVAILAQLRKVKRGLTALSKDLSPAPVVNEDEIGKAIQEKVKLTNQLTQFEERLVNATNQEFILSGKSVVEDLQKRITLLNSRLFHLKSMKKLSLQRRLTEIDHELERSSLNHIVEADLRALRARIVEKIDVITNELK